MKGKIAILIIFSILVIGIILGIATLAQEGKSANKPIDIMVEIDPGKKLTAIEINEIDESLISYRYRSIKEGEKPERYEFIFQGPINRNGKEGRALYKYIFIEH